ncbi:hypothetical protein AGMMS50239_28140 [Bacteroidia bacterium]|nr:hypothetical protein AGMMS50239_28140 [Bacteroidia bacterium]
MYLPERIQQFKEPLTEIRLINGTFYKYQVKYVYDKQKKRSAKKTVCLLGKITETEGFVLSSKNELRLRNEELPQVDIKTFGAYNLFSELMKEEELLYIIPLHRNNSLIDFSPLEKQNFKKEEKDYLSRIETHPENHSREVFDGKLNRFGTLTIIYDIDSHINIEGNKKSKKKPAKEKTVEQIIYESYKQRNDVEVMFDSYKNCLDADVSYMQNRYVMEGWLFANFLAMIACYKLYSRLLQAEQLSKHSPKEVIELSKAIYRMKIRNVWLLSEITQKMQRMFAKIQIDYLN